MKRDPPGGVINHGLSVGERARHALVAVGGVHGIVVLLLAFDLGVLHRDSHEIGVRES